MDVQQLRVTQAASDAAGPDGKWASAPAVAATTVDMANTSGRRMMVYTIANGATITAIKVNQTTTGLITGSVLLRPGDKISVTYSGGTPAMTWFYA